MSIQLASETEAFTNSTTTLATFQYGIVRLSTAGVIVKSILGTNADTYVLQNNPAASEVAEVAGVDGMNTYGQLGTTGTYDPGAELMCSTAGQFIAATDGNIVRGICLEPVAGGEVGRVAAIKLVRYTKAST